MAPIEKGTVKVRITTTRNVVYGTLSMLGTARTLDFLNSKEKFVALTDAVVFDADEGEKQEKKFVAVNITNIVSVEEL